MTVNLKTISVCIAVAAGLLIAGTASAQQEGNKQTIDITSSFKPVLRNAAKINFNTSPPKVDSALPRLTYGIPVQNLVPGLSPVTLRPLSLDIDSASAWSNSNYLKAGFGNLQTPFVEAGISLGDDRSKFNVFASHISSNGRIEHQDYSRTKLRANLAAQVSDNLAFSGMAGYNQDKYLQYGGDKATYPIVQVTDILRRYNTVSAEAGLRNTASTEFGIRYNPNLRLDLFSDNRGNKETNAVIGVPLRKSINDVVAVQLGLHADLTRYAPDKADAFGNNLFTVPLSATYKKSDLNILAGIIPSWDNGSFKLLPNLAAEFPVAQEKWVLQAGWISYFNKGSYMRLAGMNPYMSAPATLLNNRMVERFVGFKGVILNGFTYNARIGSTTFHNTPLFVNDKVSGRSFDLIFEEKLDALHLRGEIGYVRGEQFSLQSGVNWYGFNKQVTEDRAWGMLPFELNAHLRWRVVKDLWLTADAYLWEGALFRTNTGQATRVDGAFDLNAGLEFRVAKRLTIWTRFNNITNTNYQRWNQYEAYGFNMMGGVSFQFDK